MLTDFPQGSQKHADPVRVGLAVIIHTKPDYQSPDRWLESASIECLISCRPAGSVYAGFWEFPGGKAHAGEPVVACAVREAREELGVEVEPIEPLPEVRHRYDHAEVLLGPVLCRLAAGSPEPTNVAVADHRWVCVADLDDDEFPEGNRPILADLRARQADGSLARALARD